MKMRLSKCREMVTLGKEVNMNKENEVARLSKLLSRFENVLTSMSARACSSNCGSSGCSQHGHH